MTKQGRIISKYIFEIRYEPVYFFLDKRGFFADNLSDALKTDIASFASERIDLYTKDKKTWAFVSPTNCGFASVNPDTKTFFQDHAGIFLKRLFTLEGFPPQKILRLGIRSTYAAEFTGTFEQLKDSYRSHFIDLKKSVQDIFGTQISDVGLPLTFRSSDINFNTSSGPMESDQLAQFFTDVKPDLLPKISLYFDIDYFNEKIKASQPSFEVSEIIEYIRKYSELAWMKFSTLRDLLFG